MNVPGLARACSVVACLLVFTLCILPRGAWAQPDPTKCSVEPWDTYGQAFVSPGDQSGVDVLTIVVKNGAGLAVPNAKVYIDFSDCTNLCIDSQYSGLSGTADGTGTVTLDPHVGGCETCDILVVADGVTLRTFTEVTSPDWDGTTADGQVNTDDADYHGYYITLGIYNACTDFHGTGSLPGALEGTVFGLAQGTDVNLGLCGTPCDPEYPNLQWFGGTLWDGTQARWEALPAGTWTFDTGIGPPLEGWTSHVNSGTDEARLMHLNDLPPPLTLWPCAMQDSVLLFADLTINPPYGGHGPTQDNYALSPVVDLPASAVPMNGRLLQFDGYFYFPLPNYVHMMAYAKSDGGPVTPLPYVPVCGTLNCSEPGQPFRLDISSIVPSTAQEVQVGLGVVNFCTFYGSCTGVSNSTPWFDNVRFGVYDVSATALDTDGDGVPDAVEAGVDGGSGDGNGDTIPDADQNSVASYLDNDGNYVTAELPAPAPGPAPGAGFRCIGPRDPWTLPPSGKTFPCGFFDFELSGIDPGALIGVTLNLPSPCGATSYYKYGPEPGPTPAHWWDFTWNGTTGAQFGGSTITLAIADGDRGDLDLRVNGIVLDPGGPAADACSCPWHWASLWASAPPPRWDQAMVYDEARQEVVMFGGYDGTDRLDDTWAFNGTAWTQLSPAHAPTPRSGHAMAYDSDRQVIVLHGGVDATGRPGDTWEWDGTDWTMTTTTGPMLSSMGFAYDPVRHLTVLYGGTSNSGRSGSTWEYDGNTWTQVISVSLPSYRSGHAMVFDPTRGGIHMFGGQLPGGTETQDNYFYDGTWTNLGASGPSARRFHAMCFDPTCGKVRLYGGEKDGTSYGDLWMYDGGWTEVSGTPQLPGPLQHAGFVCLPDGVSVLLGGGNTAPSGGTWLGGCQSLTTGIAGDARTPGLRLANHPNPFRSRTTIAFHLDRPGRIALQVFDVAGRLVRRFEDPSIPAGDHTLVWDGRDDRGRPLRAGVYFYRLDTTSGTAVQKLVLLD